jgi:hypothetical protein
MNNHTSLLQCHCLCGCGGSPKKGLYLPGHDKIFMCRLIKCAINGDSNALPQLAALGWERFLHQAEACAVRKLSRPKFRIDRQKQHGQITFLIPKGRLSAPSLQTETESSKNTVNEEDNTFPLRVGPRSFRTWTELCAVKKPVPQTRPRHRYRSDGILPFKLWCIVRGRLRRGAGR